MKCQRCGFDVSEVNSYCSECGAPLHGQPNNGNAAPPPPPGYTPPRGNGYPYGQGNPGAGPYYSAPPPAGPYYAPPQAYSYPVSHCSWLATLLFAIFLGAIGVHRFYTGKIGAGILYIFTGGLFGIGLLVDIIMIACGNFYDSDGYPVKNIGGL